MLFSWIGAHRRACKLKQDERRQRIADLPAVFGEPLNDEDRYLLSRPVEALVEDVHDGAHDPVAILTAYGKQALNAHRDTNCLTEVMISDAVGWAENCNRTGPLAGIPVSLKDTVNVEGWDSCIGYSACVGQPASHDAPLVQLLKAAGAVPFVKTAVPTTLLSFESASDLFGRATNPHNPSYSPGGSSGGEAALLAYGGARIGVGTDVAGSVRVPAHYSGVYAVKASVGRFPKTGCATSIPGQEGVAAVYSPMARTLEDLEYFWKAVVGMRPWEYDPSVLPIPWRDVTELSESGRPLKWGVMWDDGVVAPSPACRRALDAVATLLADSGHQVVDISPPSPSTALLLGASLVLADGGRTATAPLQFLESNDPGLAQAQAMLRLPRLLRRLYAWYVRHIRGDEVYAALLEGLCAGSSSGSTGAGEVAHFWARVAEKEAYKMKWWTFWEDAGLDFVLTVPNALPAVPHGGMKHAFAACGYSFLFNVLDYTAGVLPITHVDADLDALNTSNTSNPSNPSNTSNTSTTPNPSNTSNTNTPTFIPRNAIEARAYRAYDARAMHGLPVGVQVVGRRLEEERVVEGMKIIRGVMGRRGVGYAGLGVGMEVGD